MFNKKRMIVSLIAVVITFAAAGLIPVHAAETETNDTRVEITEKEEKSNNGKKEKANNGKGKIQISAEIDYGFDGLFGMLRGIVNAGKQNTEDITNRQAEDDPDEDLADVEEDFERFETLEDLEELERIEQVKKELHEIQSTIKGLKAGIKGLKNTIKANFFRR